MNRDILSLRINRRAIGAAVLSGEALTLFDGRHLTSSRERAIQAAVRYVQKLLDQSSPSAVVCDAPAPDEAITTTQVLKAIIELVSARGLAPVVVTKAEVVGAYGLDPVPTRDQVRGVVHGLWPELTQMTSRAKPYAADAAAAALYLQCRLALRPQPT